MVEIKKLIWTFPLIGGIIILIGLLTPAAYMIYRSSSINIDFYLWMCNLYFSHRDESGLLTTRIEFDTELISLIPSILVSVVITILSIITIITANKYRKDNLSLQISWLISALLTIAATITWIIIMEVSRRVLYGHEFWGIFSPNFGVIAPFLGAGLEIMGFILLKKN